MRRFNSNERNVAKDYVQDMEEEYRDKEREFVPREPRDHPLGGAVRVRVELKRKYNDPGRNFKEMLHEFRRRVTDAGILPDYKEHQHYESKGEKNRRSRRDSAKKLLMAALTKKIVAGERVEGHGGMVKKIMSNLKKEKEKKEKKKRRDDKHKHHQDDGFNKHRYNDDYDLNRG